MSKRMYVSVPMSGRERRDILQDVFDVTTTYRKKYSDDTETEWVHNVDCEGGDGPLCQLGNAIIKLGTCDGIIMCPGWRDDQGCRAIYGIAKEYDITLYDLDK